MATGSWRISRYEISFLRFDILKWITIVFHSSSNVLNETFIAFDRLIRYFNLSAVIDRRSKVRNYIQNDSENMNISNIWFRITAEKLALLLQFSIFKRYFSRKPLHNMELWKFEKFLNKKDTSEHQLIVIDLQVIRNTISPLKTYNRICK